MAKKSKVSRASIKAAKDRVLGAFDLAGSDDDGPGLEPASGSENENEYSKYLTGDVNPSDDEDIDSDDALGSSDDYDVADSDGEYASVDEGELVSLTEAWDQDGKEEASEAEDEPTRVRLNLVDEEEDDDEDEEGEEGEEDEEDEEDEDEEDEDDEDDDEDEEVEDDKDNDEDSDSDSNEENPEKLAQLREAISSLSKSTPRASEKPRKRLQVITAPENEFSVPGEAKKLSLSALAASVNDPRSSELKLLKDKQGSTKALKSLAVPLPRRLQQRQDRAEAYELTKEEVSKWNERVKANRESEHLQFPINPAEPVIDTTAFAPLRPTTDLERRVNSILVESGLATERAESAFEELQTAKLSIEEVQKRRSELQLMRELMFREEQKAKRIKKIKSKSYRRVHKKERERLHELMGDNEEDQDDDEAHDLRRARERMLLKHKTSGKWAKRMVEQGFTKDKETRAEMEAMLRRGEDLRRKIEGRTRDSDSDSDSGDEADQQFIEDTLNEKDEAQNSKPKGIMAMRFMMEAAEAEKKANREALEKLQSSNDFEEIDEPEQDKSIGQKINEGRRVYAPGVLEARQEVEQELEQAKEEEVEEHSGIGKKLSRANHQAKTVSQPEHETTTDGLANPWLSSSQTQKTSKVVRIGQNASAADKAQDKVRKHNKRTRGDDASGDAVVDVQQTLQVVDSDRDRVEFSQAELIEKAFAGDNVVEEFQQEKRLKIEQEGDQVIDETLPGWGSWAGGDIAPAKNKVVRKVKGVAPGKRADAKLKDVIISERVNKKATKYNASAVPFPYENREQYELSLQMPIGKEWSTRDTHQKLTKPRVIVAPGRVIDPLKRK